MRAARVGDLVLLSKAGRDAIGKLSEPRRVVGVTEGGRLQTCPRYESPCTIPAHAAFPPHYFVLAPGQE